MISFLKFTRFYFLISATVIFIGLVSMLKWGYNFSIDFVGGTNIEYQVKGKINKTELKKTLEGNRFKIDSFFNDKDTITIKAKPIDAKQEMILRDSLKNNLKNQVVLLRFETVGPILGRETMIKTLVASLLGILGILGYMTFAFSGLNFALAAIIALLHDFLVVVGSYSLMSHFFVAQVDTLFVTAALTTMSFSVHDTIIIFDKIREHLKTYGKGDVESYANQAVTETMIRSFNNSMTIIFMLLALTLLGGSTIRFFVVTLLIGTITGTYSSPFVATPILVWLEKRKMGKF